MMMTEEQKEAAKATRKRQYTEYWAMVKERHTEVFLAEKKVKSATKELEDLQAQVVQAKSVLEEAKQLHQQAIDVAIRQVPQEELAQAEARAMFKEVGTDAQEQTPGPSPDTCDMIEV